MADTDIEAIRKRVERCIRAPLNLAYARGDHKAIQVFERDNVAKHWPLSWAKSWLKPKDRRRDLIRAAALIIAEIERLDRAALTKGVPVT